jgi:hypothetical protein
MEQRTRGTDIPVARPSRDRRPGWSGRTNEESALTRLPLLAAARRGLSGVRRLGRRSGDAPTPAAGADSHGPLAIGSGIDSCGWIASIEQRDARIRRRLDTLLTLRAMIPPALEEAGEESPLPAGGAPQP